MQLLQLAAWTAEMQKEHVAHQQRRLLQPTQSSKQQWQVDLLCIPAFHQDMLLPGGQTYLDAAGRATFNSTTGEDRAV
jgi:hypothetical protein